MRGSEPEGAEVDWVVERVRRIDAGIAKVWLWITTILGKQPVVAVLQCFPKPFPWYLRVKTIPSGIRPTRVCSVVMDAAYLHVSIFRLAMISNEVSGYSMVSFVPAR